MDLWEKLVIAKRRHLGISLLLLFFAHQALTGGRQDQPQSFGSDRPNQPTLYLYNGHQLDEPRSQFEIHWLRGRKTAQEEQARGYKVFHDFKFVDKLPESGITFKHSIV